MTRRKPKPSDYPALECPNCGKPTKCVDIARDGGAKYRCRNKDAHGGNGGTFSWWIDTNGDIRFGRAYG